MRRLLYMVAAMFALSSPSWAAQPAAETAKAQEATPEIVVPQLDDVALETWQEKKNIYVGVLNSTKRVVDSGKRYRSWVDDKKGPTGKERVIYGLYDIKPSALEALKKAATDAETKQPSIPAMDKAVGDMADALATLQPVISEAHGYYERKDYKEDKMARGKEMHPVLVKGFSDFAEAQQRLSRLEDQLSTGLDRQMLDKVERVSGKRLQWQMRNVLMHARPMLDFMPTSLDETVDTEKFDEKLRLFADAVRSFDDYVKAPDTDLKKEARPSPSTADPDRLLAALREFRDIYPNRKNKASMYERRIKDVVSAYNTLIGSSNRTRFLVKK